MLFPIKSIDSAALNLHDFYAESLDPLRVGELVNRLAPLWVQLRIELSVFADFLEGVSRADGLSG